MGKNKKRGMMDQGAVMEHLSTQDTDRLTGVWSGWLVLGFVELGQEVMKK